MPATSDVGTNIRNLYHGAGHRKRVQDQGKAGARKQEIAIAYDEARRVKGKRKKRRRG